MSKKSSTKKTENITADARLLFQALNQPGVSEDAQVDIAQYIDDVVTSTLLSDYAHNEELFMRYFPEGWEESDQHTRRQVSGIIQKLKAGESVEEIHNDFERERAERRAQREEEQRNMPEPKNWLSSEWRYWKIRQLTDAFESHDPERYTAAWTETKALIKDVANNEDFQFWYALAFLPHLLDARQGIAQLSPATPDRRRKPAYLKKGK